MAEATKVFTAHIPLSLADRIDRMAEQLEHTRAWVIKQALANWIAEEEARDRLTQEAMLSVEEGRVVPHGRVLAWADSLDDENSQPLPR
jgi:hypothetical protein